MHQHTDKQTTTHKHIHTQHAHTHVQMLLRNRHRNTPRAREESRIKVLARLQQLHQARHDGRGVVAVGLHDHDAAGEDAQLHAQSESLQLLARRQDVVR